MKELPFVSVIIPTRNRAASVRRALEALAVQTYPAERFAVTVVADGCTDATLEVLRQFHAPFEVQTIAQPQAGAAAARNAGAASARGTLLVFLDDDVEADPQLIAAHVDAHSRRSGVVIGHLSPVLAAQRGFFRNALRRWWEAKFDALAHPGHRFHAFDLLSGNFSLAAELFARCGGFDPSLRCHEDYELGIRLVHHGIRFTYAPEATGRHHELTDLRGALRRKFEEGQADVRIGRGHPEIRPALPMTRLLPRRAGGRRVWFRLAFARSSGGDTAAAAAARLLQALERLRLRSRWRRLLDDLLTYWYWRGMAQELPTASAAAEFIDGAVAPVSELDLDLRGGMAEAQGILDETRPAAVRLRFGTQGIAHLLPVPGAEPWRGEHLVLILGMHLTRPLLRAMAQDGSITPPFNVKRLLDLTRAPARYDLREYGIEPG